MRILIVLAYALAACGSSRSAPADGGWQDGAALDAAAQDGATLDGSTLDSGIGCVGSGGTVSMGLCCLSTGDFPNRCLAGACGCAPSSSHMVQVCDCPSRMCFDGQRCVSR